MTPSSSAICILIVDDSALSRRFARESLLAAGYRTTEATGPEEALVALEAGGIDLVLLDLLMPGVTDPTELVSRVKARSPHIPIVVASANVQARVQEAVIQAGAAGFVAKPIKASDLIPMIESALRT